MKRVLLTGMSGTGNSSLIGRLGALDYRAFDVDGKGWVRQASDGGWIWREEVVEELLRDHADGVLFLSGCAESQVRFCDSVLARTTGTASDPPCWPEVLRATREVRRDHRERKEAPMIDITSTSVTLMVEDLDRSQAFYADALGFQVEYRAGPHFAMLRRAGLRIGLHPHGAKPGAGSGKGIAIGLEVPDIRAAVKALWGIAEFPGGVVEDGSILRADFRDPDGTSLYLVELR